MSDRDHPVELSAGHAAPAMLAATLAARIPGASLRATPLPDCPSIQLWLLDPDYPQWQLSAEDAASLMEAPPFWSFCWASGQVLARYLLEHPALVAGRRVVDFGAGSGVVAIAAMLAGASECWAVDSDPVALLACAANAQLNDVPLQLAPDIRDIKALPPGSLLTLADVFYDADNLPMLAQLKQRCTHILIADSRRKACDFPGFQSLLTRSSHTVPDLDESREFRRVTLYSHQGRHVHPGSAV